MMTINKKLMMTASGVLLTGLMTACGGGGGGAASAGSITNPNNLDPVVDTPAEQEPTPTPVTTTGDIVVPQNFNINDATSWGLTIDLSLDLASNGGEAFVSICSDYTGSAPNFSIDYGNCLVSETTANDDFDKAVSVSTAVDSLVLAVWFPSAADPANAAIVQEFTGLGPDNATLSYVQ